LRFFRSYRRLDMVGLSAAQELSKAITPAISSQDHAHVSLGRLGGMNEADAQLSVSCYRVPLYAIASLIALFSLDAAFFIDTVRDLYEVSSRRGMFA
jgi:hypothetical protein